MANVAKAYFMTKIPHTNIKSVVKFLFNSNRITTRKNFIQRYIFIRYEKRISYRNEFKFMPQSLLMIIFQRDWQITGEHEERIAGDNHSLKFVYARTKVFKA